MEYRSSLSDATPRNSVGSRAIIREVRRHPADVIQSQHFYTNLYAVAAARILRVPDVGAIRNTLDYEVRSTGRLLGPLSLTAPRVIAANSLSAIAEARQRGIATARLFHLPNVVDTQRFAASASPVERPGVRFLAAGRLVPQKRFDRFLESLAKVRRRSRGNITGTIVGSGPLRAELEDHARALGLLPDGVTFEGSLSDMRSAYSSADVFVLTSDHEGTPNVLLEAMASALPVVATNVGGVVEHVASGENGIIVEPGDDDALVSAFSKLADDPALRARLGRKAREDIQQTASLTELPRFLSDLYSLRQLTRTPAPAREAGLRPAATTRSSEALRVLAVTNMYPTPGWPTAGIFLREQVEGLKRAGVEVEVYLIDRLTEGVGSYVGVGERVAARVRDFDPHLVHVLYGGVIADRVTRAVRDRPVIVTYHGSDLQGSVLASPKVRLMAEYGVWCSRRAARLASGIIIVSEHLREFLTDSRGRRDARVIPCGIDLDRFSPGQSPAARDRLGWRQDRFHVLFATSSHDRIKRPDLARAAVDRLSASGTPVELHVMRDVPYDDVPTWLNASDALLLTSLREGSPTIVKEALACNRPVVSVAVGDVPEQIAGIDGCYLAQPTPDSLAEMLRRVAAGPRRVDGRERAALYDTRNTTERLKTFYGEVLDVRRPQSSAIPAVPSEAVL